jgi:hypothetical protein
MALMMDFELESFRRSYEKAGCIVNGSRTSHFVNTQVTLTEANVGLHRDPHFSFAMHGFCS